MDIYIYIYISRVYIYTHLKNISLYFSQTKRCEASTMGPELSLPFDIFASESGWLEDDFFVFGMAYFF